MTSLAGALIRPFLLEPMAGIGPASHPYRGCALPLDDTGKRLVGAAGIGPATVRCRRTGMPFTYAPWSGSSDLHAPFPVPQTGGTLSCPEPEIKTDPRSP